MIIAGALIGALVVAGWWITGDAGAFDPAAARPDSVSYSGPLALAMEGLCAYAIDDEAEGLEAALADLRIADAKHRLAYILTRAALLDCERGRVDTATERATEALGYATLLERATEMLLANAVLSHDCAATDDRKGAARFAKEVERISAVGAAAWTNDIAARLSGKNKRAARTEGRHYERNTCRTPLGPTADRCEHARDAPECRRLPRHPSRGLAWQPAVGERP